MEKLLRKTGINQSLRCLLIVASLLFGSSANVWAEDTVVDFSNGLPSGWKNTSGTIAKQNYAETVAEAMADCYCKLAQQFKVRLMKQRSKA